MKFFKCIARLLALLLSFSFTAAAASQDVTFRPFEGDATLDTAINASDALMILQHSVELLTLDATQAKVADANGDGTINASDALRVLQISVGLYDPLDVMQITEGWEDFFSDQGSALSAQDESALAERIEYDSLDQFVEKILAGENGVASGTLLIPSAAEGVSVTAVWSEQGDYGYTVTRDGQSFAFSFDPDGTVPQQAIRALILGQQNTIGSLPSLFWADWSETSALVASIGSKPTVAFLEERVSVTVQSERTVDFATVLTGAESQTATRQSLFAWLDWFEFTSVK